MRFPLEKNKTKQKQNKTNQISKRTNKAKQKHKMKKKKTIKTKYYQVRIPGQLCERSLLHRPRLFYECLKFPGFVLQPVEEKNKENLNPLRGLEHAVLRATSNYLFQTFLCLDNVVIDSMFTAFRKL